MSQSGAAVARVPVSSGYTLWSETYDKESNLLIAADKQHDWLRTQALMMAPSRERALDLACGTGRNLPLLESRFRFVVGLDMSEGMLNRAQKMRSKISTELLMHSFGDGTVSFESGQFAFVNCSLALMHFRSLERFFAEVAEALSPDGILYLTDAAEGLLISGSSPNFDMGGTKHVVDHTIHRARDVWDSMTNAGLVPLDARTILVDDKLIDKNPKFIRYRGQPCLTCFTAKKAGAL